MKKMKKPEELVRILADNAIFGAGQDEDPMQQDWSADLLEAAVLIIDAYCYPCALVKTLRDNLLERAGANRKYAHVLRSGKLDG